MSRKPDWRTALHNTIEARRTMPFAWGQNDCALFVADCVAAMTGVDLGSGYRGSYDSAEGAAAALKRAGFADLAAMAGRVFAEIHPLKATAGDVAAFESDGTWSLGIVAGEQVTVLRLDGLGVIERRFAQRAFRVA